MFSALFPGLFEHYYGVNSATNLGIIYYCFDSRQVLRSSKLKAEAEEDYKRSKTAFMMYQESCEKHLVKDIKDIKHAESVYTFI